MEKMNCDIIQDLIPSYVDEICSDATKNCVEEHIAHCENCRQIVTFCKEKGLSGKKAEMEGLDGLKKIRQLIEYKGYACFGLVLFVLVFFGVNLFVSRNFFPSGDAYNVMCIVCVCLVLLAGRGFRGKGTLGKTDYLLAFLSVAADLYITVMYGSVLQQALDGAERIFWMKPVETGPFLGSQLAVVYVLHLAFFLYGLAGIFRRDKNCGQLLCLSTAGCFLLLQEMDLLFRMDSRETVMRAFAYGIVSTTVIGLAGLAGGFLVSRAGRRRDAVDVH